MTPFPPPEPSPAASAARRRPDRAGAPTWEDRQRRRRTMRTTRWAMIGLGVVAGIVLIAAGATLAGSVIAGLALVRGVVMLTMGRRRPLRSAGTGRLPAPGPASAAPGPAPRSHTRPLHRLARRELGVAAAAIGVDVTELRRQRHAGRSIADVARDRGVDLDGVVQAVLADATVTIDRARRNGNPAAIEAGASEGRIATWASWFVEQRGGPGPSA